MSTGMALEKIGRYEIVGQLGKGAMGIVYKALDPTIGRTVALKTMRLDVQGPETSELLARFRNEARLAGVLNHPNIVTIYDAGEINGLFYMAMEYIEGKTVYQLLLQEHALTMEKVLDLARQICAGLDAASAQRVVHRDIKPANIMMLPSGTVKIMDFGIAKAGGSMTSTGEVLGTPNYMSPEQVKGKPLDGRSDLFSFGVILYEMVTGEKPFAGDNITTIIYKIVNEEPIPPRELNPAIHPGLNRVVLKALAKNPQNRYQLGSDLVQALENHESVSEAEDAPKPIPAAVFNFPQQAAAPAPARTTPPQRARNGTPATPKAVMGRVPGKKPLVAQKSIPLLPVVIGVLAVVIVVVSGVIFYVKHEARQRAEMERLLQQKNAAETEETPPATAPERVPTPTPLASSQAPSFEEPREPSPWQKPRHTASLGPKHTSAMMNLGEMVLSTEPDGADVKIDGASQSDWRTPFTATAVSPGPHTVIFSKNGYAGETHVIEVNAGRPAFLHVALKAMNSTAAVSVSSDPPGAAIIIDDRETARTTPAQVVLSRGAHSIAVRKPGFQEATTNVDLQEGQPYTFAPVLKPLDLAKAKETHTNPLARFFGAGGDRVNIEIHTAPRGAEISINGELYSKTTPTKLSLSPGTYELTLRLPGYKALHKNLTVEKGPAIQIDETLQK
ncbi:MAG TPA: serine/threonine-protein kinase [Terriglobales bacterium]|nr:serine/threonine-protein kinase [Terriglobales bacterium]